MKKLKKLVKENNKSIYKINSYNRLLKLTLNRKIVKKALMVKPYNASLDSMAEYIIEQMLPMANGSKY
jgi:DNA-dependent RNA polymerase